MFLNNLKSQSNKIFLFGAVLLFSTPFVINANNIEVKKNNYESYYECLLNSNFGVKINILILNVSQYL